MKINLTLNDTINDELQYKMTTINFCYWDAKSQQDLMIIIVNQTITTTIGITALIRIPILLQLYRHKKNRIITLMLVHLLVLLWAITQSIVNFYSIGIFLFELDIEQTANDMIEYSHNFAIICSFPGFIVQTIFLVICYKCCSNILKNEDISIFSKYSYILKSTIFYYCIIRVIIHGTTIILIIISINQEVGTYSMIQFISLITDSGIIFIFLTCTAKLLILQLKGQNLEKLKLEYLMMIVCSFIRINIDIAFLAINVHSDQDNLCVGKFESHITYSLLYNIISNVFMHFVPLAIILKIYNYGDMEANIELLNQRQSNLTQNSDGIKSFMKLK